MIRIIRGIQYTRIGFYIIQSKLVKKDIVCTKDRVVKTQPNFNSLIP